MKHASVTARILAMLVLVEVWSCSAVEASQPMACDPLLDPSEPARILLVGNSHIFMNDLPLMLSRLAVSAGIDCECGQSAYGGYELSQHATDERTLWLIEGEPWDVVVLQERTTVLLTRLAEGTEPAVLALDEAIASVAARTLLLMMWAPYSGTVAGGSVDASQEEVARSTMAVAERIGACVAPVGLAWEAVEDADSGINLWQSGREHASEAGTYLMACVLYATLWGRSPVGLGSMTGLSESDALTLQEVAAETVSRFTIRSPD